MNEVEITVEIKCTKEELVKKLYEANFKVIGEFFMQDDYYTHLNLSVDTKFQDLIANSIIARYIEDSGEIIQQILYKNKNFNAGGKVISETKIKCSVADTKKANEIFKSANFTNWCSKTAHAQVFSNDKLEFVVQDVKNLGLFLELEQGESQTGTPEQIISNLISQARTLDLPLGDDFQVSLAKLLYIQKFGSKHAN